MDNFKWENGREDFFTKHNTKDNNFPSLVFLSSRMVYYLNLNCIYNLERTVIDCWTCDCDKFFGCKKANGIRDYCDLCSLSVKHFSYVEEKKYKVRHLIKKHIVLVNDFKENSHVNIRVGDHTEKSIDFNKGTQYVWSFYNYVFKSNYFKCNTFD